MIKVAITGSTGMVGSRIQELLYHDFEFIPLLHEQVDITNRAQVMDFIEPLEFDIFLHVSGYTNVDRAEKEKERAYALNVEGTKHVYDATLQKGKKFIYISTDFVFDGSNPPYTEEGKPHPLGIYGQTKYQAEELIKDNAMIARISYPYRSSFEKKSDFVRSIYSLLKRGKKISMITDSAITPTYIDDIARCLSHLMKNFTPQLFHIVGASSISPYDAAMIIAKRFDLNTSLIEKTTFELFSKGRAPRPQYSEIKSIKNDFYPMIGLAEGLTKVVIEG